MEKSLVIDTNVFIHSCSLDQEWFFDCVSLLTKVREGKLLLAVDNEGIVFGEYYSNLVAYRKTNAIAGYILQLINQEKRQRKRTKSFIPIPKSKVESLANDGFHSKDIIFLRIAPQTTLKIIVSSDTRSFLHENYKNRIESELGILVKHPADYDEIMAIADI